MTVAVQYAPGRLSPSEMRRDEARATCGGRVSQALGKIPKATQAPGRENLNVSNLPKDKAHKKVAEVMAPTGRVSRALTKLPPGSVVGMSQSGLEARERASQTARSLGDALHGVETKTTKGEDIHRDEAALRKAAKEIVDSLPNHGIKDWNHSWDIVMGPKGYRVRVLESKEAFGVPTGKRYTLDEFKSFALSRSTTIFHPIELNRRA